jgi:hypothetical protein
MIASEIGCYPERDGRTGLRAHATPTIGLWSLGKGRVVARLERWMRLTHTVEPYPTVPLNLLASFRRREMKRRKGAMNE